MISGPIGTCLWICGPMRGLHSIKCISTESVCLPVRDVRRPDKCSWLLTAGAGMRSVGCSSPAPAAVTVSPMSLVVFDNVWNKEYCVCPHYRVECSSAVHQCQVEVCSKLTMWPQLTGGWVELETGPVPDRAGNGGCAKVREDCTITEEAPTRAFPRLKAPTMLNGC